jgi:hypothetical protein
MTKKLIFFPFLLITLCTSSVCAQHSEKDITNEFFKLYSIDPMKAFDYAFATNIWMERNQDAVDNLKNQYSNLLTLIGEYHGYELITEKSIGERLKLLSFMAKYERQPIRLTFILYKPHKTWQVQNLKYDDKLDEELEEAAKQNRD